MNALDQLLRGAVVILPPGVRRLPETVTLPLGCRLVGLDVGKAVVCVTAPAPEDQVHQRGGIDPAQKAVAAAPAHEIRLEIATEDRIRAALLQHGGGIGRWLWDDAQLAGDAHGDGSGNDDRAAAIAGAAESQREAS